MNKNKTPTSNNGEIKDFTMTAIAIWQYVMTELQAETSASVFGKWLSDLEFVAEIDGVIQIAAGNAIQRDRVSQDYLRRINTIWNSKDERGRRVTITCWNDLSDDVRQLAEINRVKAAVSVASADASVEETEDAIDVRSSMGELTFDNLVVADSNRVAATVARRIALGEGAPAKTVYFYGRHGVGKTHLLQAIQAEMEVNDDARSVIYMSAEEFMVAFVEGVKRRDTSDLKSRLRSADVLLIDDLQAIAGMGGTQKEFFSNIRAVAARGGQVVITADESPSQLSSLNARVREELQGGATIEVNEPDEEMRRRIVKVKADSIAQDHPEFLLDDECVDLIVRRVRGPGRQLYGAVCNVFTATTFVGNPVTLEDVEAAVRRQLGDQKPPTIDQVKRAVMNVFDITKTDIESARRSRNIAYPRQIAMYLCRKLTTRSLPQIGRYFGNRDHTTVLYAVRKLEDLMAKDETLKADVNKVELAIAEVQDGSRS